MKIVNEGCHIEEMNNKSVKGVIYNEPFTVEKEGILVLISFKGIDIIVKHIPENETLEIIEVVNPNNRKFSIVRYDTEYFISYIGSYTHITISQDFNGIHFNNTILHYKLNIRF